MHSCQTFDIGADRSIHSSIPCLDRQGPYPAPHEDGNLKVQRLVLQFVRHLLLSGEVKISPSQPVLTTDPVCESTRP